MSRITVITPSFNKKDYLPDAINTVCNQTFQNYEHWIIENSTDGDTRNVAWDAAKVSDRIKVFNEFFTEEERKEQYPTALLLNQYLPLIKSEYFFYLSDDDIIDATLFDKCVTYLDAHPEAGACYVGMHGVDMQGNDHGTIKAENVFPVGTNLDCSLDGGQVFARTELLKKIKQPYFSPDYADAAHCDGLFLNKLSEFAQFDPINEVLLTHRRTPQSTWTNQ